MALPIGYLTRRVQFAASHRLHSRELSDEENRLLFDKCNYPNGHGHNYVLEVTLRGAIDQKTGMIMNIRDLKEIMNREIMDRVDHRHFNLDVPPFDVVNPTTENVAVIFWQWLDTALPKGLLFEIKLWETDHNIVTYRGE
jgi:6-pyruvoyltetrahydropterin/6-carboxytetrahydropterin synthase